MPKLDFAGKWFMFSASLLVSSVGFNGKKIGREDKYEDLEKFALNSVSFKSFGVFQISEL